MSKQKTLPNQVSVDEFLSTLEESRLNETKTLIDIMSKVSGEEPVMWGSNIVGFGSYNYKYASGREGVWMKIGFSPRKAKLSLYITSDASKYTQDLDEIGKYSLGKGCIYINKLSDVDISNLTKVIEKIYNQENQ